MKIPACPYCGFRGHRFRLIYDIGYIRPKLTSMKGIQCNHCLWTSRLSRFWWITIRRWRRKDGSMVLRRERWFVPKGRRSTMTKKGDHTP